MGKVSNSQIIPETGISADYWNEYSARPVWGVLDISDDRNLVSLQQYPVKKYRERFSEDIYYDVITPKNQERVARLDQIADEVNALSIPSTFSIEKLARLICEAHRLIYGKEELIF